MEAITFNDIVSFTYQNEDLVLDKFFRYPPQDDGVGFEKIDCMLDCDDKIMFYVDMEDGKNYNAGIDKNEFLNFMIDVLNKEESNV